MCPALDLARANLAMCFELSFEAAGCSGNRREPPAPPSAARGMPDLPVCFRDMSSSTPRSEPRGESYGVRGIKSASPMHGGVLGGGGSGSEHEES